MVARAGHNTVRTTQPPSPGPTALPPLPRRPIGVLSVGEWHLRQTEGFQVLRMREKRRVGSNGSLTSKPLLAFSLLSPAGAHFSVALLATPRTLCPFSEMGTVETLFRRQKDEDNDAPRLFSKNLTFHLGRGAGSDWAKRLVKIENRPPTPSTR